MRALETERKRNDEWLRKNAKRNGRTYRTYEEYRVYVPDRYIVVGISIKLNVVTVAAVGDVEYTSCPNLKS